MIKSIKCRFGRIYSGPIFGRFQRGTITDFGQFFRNVIFFRFWRLQITESGRAYIHR
ncbi:unnamed protein product [Linum tenue]|uniref:Uncharacterized protein n=1 Tax=Linum tenue TaxID=586396 RepID=A0AAV0M3D8_9ROSI|nr:unnamed protein product [Linum tenue]